MGAVGVTTIDFGAQPGTQRASVTITGQAGIVSGSQVEAFMMADSTADHNASEHELGGLYIEFVCGNIVAATGFDIIGISERTFTGQFNVHWVWI